MTTPPWMIVRLGQETAPHHAAADEARLAAMTVASRNGYRALLRRIYGFESSVEHAVLRMRELETGFIEERLRSMRLREDLRALGLSEVEIGCTAYSASISIESSAHALGWLFVLERQMLVSGVIKRQLERVLGDAIQDATGYLSAYGDRPGTRFRAFADDVSKLARRHPPKLIVAGASDAFRAQRQWYGSGPTTAAAEPTSHPAALDPPRTERESTAGVARWDGRAQYSEPARSKAPGDRHPVRTLAHRTGT
jgi:heme oxygenase